MHITRKSFTASTQLEKNFCEEEKVNEVLNFVIFRRMLIPFNLFSDWDFLYIFLRGKLCARIGDGI